MTGRPTRHRYEGNDVIRAMTGFLLGTCVVYGQTAPGPAFDVASIRPASSREGGETIECQPGSLIMRNTRFLTLVKWAYGIQTFQISGPDWINEARYDLSAKAPSQAPEKEMRSMLQGLLAERFKLETHRQTKELQSLLLVQGKTPHKMQESQGGGPSTLHLTKMGAAGERSTIAELAELISRQLRIPVFDTTGLAGRYYIQFDLTPFLTDEAMKDRGGPGRVPADAPMIVATAIQAQLGLKLESKKMPIEMVIVDRAEKTPVEN
jgi:uncharacterized protein (TIGR03435 family)